MPNPNLVTYLLLATSAIIPGAFGLSTDRDQDLVVDADSAELDNKANVAIYRGAVAVTQGSLYMTGETLTVHFDEQGDARLVTISGTPATYQQLPDNAELYDRAWARQMKYDVPGNRIVLIGDARVSQEDMQFKGQRIDYDTVTNKATMSGQEQQDIDSKERVQTIIQGSRAP